MTHGRCPLFAKSGSRFFSRRTASACITLLSLLYCSTVQSIAGMRRRMRHLRRAYTYIHIIYNIYYIWRITKPGDEWCAATWLTYSVQRFARPVRGTIRVFGLDRGIAQQRVGHQTVVQYHVRIRPAVSADQPIGRVLCGPQRVAEILRNTNTADVKNNGRTRITRT